MVQCDACGREMAGSEDHAGSNETVPYCKECAWEDGTLKSQEEVREALINYYMRETENDRGTVEQVVDEILHKMPAWNLQVSAPLSKAEPKEESSKPQKESKDDKGIDESNSSAGKDELLGLVKERGKITWKDAAKELKLDTEVMNRLVESLIKAELVKKELSLKGIVLHYIEQTDVPVGKLVQN